MTRHVNHTRQGRDGTKCDLCWFRVLKRRSRWYRKVVGRQEAAERVSAYWNVLRKIRERRVGH